MKQLAGFTLYHPLRLSVMSAQIRAGLWRAGGGEEEVWGQSVMYSSVHFQKYFDLDMLLIQVSIKNLAICFINAGCVDLRNVVGI